MWMAKRHLAVIVFFIVFALTSCGGGGGGDSSTVSVPVTPVGSTTVSGQVQASYINGVRVCVDETVGTANENCAATTGKGNFSLQNAQGKKLSLLIDTVPIGSISADKATTNVTITPLLLSGGDSAKALKITAIFHQAGTNTGSGADMTSDLKNVKANQINTNDLASYLNGAKNTLTIGQTAIDYTKENLNQSIAGTWKVTQNDYRIPAWDVVTFTSDGQIQATEVPLSPGLARTFYGTYQYDNTNISYNFTSVSAAGISSSASESATLKVQISGDTMVWTSSANLTVTFKKQ